MQQEGAMPGHIVSAVVEETLNAFACSRRERMPGDIVSAVLEETLKALHAAGGRDAWSHCVCSLEAESKWEVGQDIKFQSPTPPCTYSKATSP